MVASAARYQLPTTSYPAIWLQGFDKTIQHPTYLCDAVQHGLAVVVPYEPEAACDFKLNFHLALRSKRDVQVIEKGSLSLATPPFAYIGWD